VGGRGVQDRRTPPGSSSSGDSNRYRIPWAELLGKVFAVDVLECPDCGGRLRVVAYIAEGKVARGIPETRPRVIGGGGGHAALAGPGDDQ
jgi:hypothetical protein